jgi:hypothetical protein
LPGNIERIVDTCIVFFNFENFWVDHEAGNAGDVDLPCAVEIVKVVAAIVEAGRRDDCVVGDFTTANKPRSIWILDELASFWVSSRNCGCNSKKAG